MVLVVDVVGLGSFSWEEGVARIFARIHANAVLTNADNGESGTGSLPTQTVLTGNQRAHANRRVNTRVIMAVAAVLVAGTPTFAALVAARLTRKVSPIRASTATKPTQRRAVARLPLSFVGCLLTVLTLGLSFAVPYRTAFAAANNAARAQTANAS